MLFTALKHLTFPFVCGIILTDETADGRNEVAGAPLVEQIVGATPTAVSSDSF